MKVVAKQMGFYGLKRVKEGTVFTLKEEKHFSKIWMEKVTAKKGKKEEPKTPAPAAAGQDDPKI